jgi:hypothetical protein
MTAVDVFNHDTAAVSERVRWQVVEARWHPDGLEIIVDGSSTMIPASEGLLPAFRFDRGPEPIVCVTSDDRQ